VLVGGESVQGRTCFKLMATTSAHNEAEAILRQMREVRVELRDDVRQMVDSAHKMADISRYVRAYPWLCVGAALAAGYLIVPQRSVVVRPDAEALIELARKHKLFVRTEEPTAKKKRGGLLADLFSLAAATLLQGGLKVVTSQVSQAFAQPSHHPNGSNGRPPGVAT
jgi:hypothetical protein